MTHIHIWQVDPCHSVFFPTCSTRESLSGAGFVGHVSMLLPNKHCQNTEGNSKHWSQPVDWPHPFFIPHQTPDVRLEGELLSLCCLFNTLPDCMHVFVCIWSGLVEGKCSEWLIAALWHCDILLCTCTTQEYLWLYMSLFKWLSLVYQ